MQLTFLHDYLSFENDDSDMLPALDKKLFSKDDTSHRRESITLTHTDTRTTLQAHTADGSSERVMIERVCVCVYASERKSACVKQHELMIEFVVVVSKEPEAVITSTAEPFRKIGFFHKTTKCLSTICFCMCVCVCPEAL